MSATRVTWTGDAAMKKKLEAYAREFPLAARRATREYAQERLLPVARDRAPEKTGALKASAKVKVSIRKKEGKENIAASVVFTVPYARKVHEHNPKHPQTEKFLERTILEAVGSAGADIRERIDLKKLSVGR